MGHQRTHAFSALGHCGVQFRLMESSLLRIHWGFNLGSLWGSTQVDGSLASSGPTWASVFRHCGVQLRLTEL